MERMVIATVLAGVLWYLSVVPPAEAEFLCPGKANCSCTRGIKGDFELLCPMINPSLIATLFPTKYIQLQCTYMKDWRHLSLISGLELGPIDSFSMRLCPLPGISFKEFMSTIGIPSTNVLHVASHGNLSNTLTSRHLEGLHDLNRLYLNSNSLTDLPEDLFKDLGNLTWLDLKNNNVRLPKGIFRYVPKLEVLELGSNNINYLEPGIFKNLTKLRLLNLWGNRLHNLTRSVFSDVQNLENLDLNINGLTTLTPDLFADLIKLKNINLFGNDFVTLPQSLFRSTPLVEKIQINNNRRTLNTLPSGFFANLTELKELNLRECNFSYLPEDLLWGSLSLINLTLKRNLLTELPENIFRDSKEVQMINLSHNMLVSLPGSVFMSLAKLKVLDLSNNKLTNISQNLFALTYNLEILKLSHNRIEYIHPQAFDGSAQLKTLDMSHNQLKNIGTKYADEAFGMRSILHACNNLESLDLSHNQISNLYSDWRISMLSLKKLDLSYNNFTNIAIDELMFLSSQLTIDMSNNNISTVFMHNAERLAQLKYEEVRTAIPENDSVKLLLKGNPINCDCKAYHLVRYFKGLLSPEVNLIATIDDADLACNSPQELKGEPVKGLDPRVLLCPIGEIYKEEECPKGCKCLYRPSDSSLIVDCSYRGLTSAPETLPVLTTTEDMWIDMNHTELDLTGNRIKTLPEKLGEGYSKVVKIYLSHNNLTKINLTSFSPLLQMITLDNNNLTRMDSESLKMIEESNHIQQVTLSHNPWQCDCQTKTFPSFIQTNYKKIPNIKNITCADGVPLTTLTASELCPTSTVAVGIISMAVAFLGLLIGGSAALYYRYQREIKVWLYANQICLWFVTEEELDKDKQYDAFISFSHQDEKFVVEDLVPGLENGPTKYKLCLHYRDWVVGEFIPNQIANSVEASRRTIVVLSPNFLESVWGRMEFRAAHSQALSEGRARVIIILYGDIGETDNLDPELKAYLTMNTYVKWGDPWFWEKLRYALPHPPELSKGIPLLSRQTLRMPSGEKLMNGTDPNSTPPAITTPPADTLLIDPLKTLANSKPV